MKSEFYAHSLNGKPPEDWHRLEDHLKAVAEMARKFANEFNTGDWEYMEGLGHDFDIKMRGYPPFSKGRTGGI